MNDNFRRIKDAHVTLCDGLMCVSKHTTVPQEFLEMWVDHGEPTLQEELEDGIPYVTYTVEGTKWFMHVNLFARTLSELNLLMRRAA